MQVTTLKITRSRSKSREYYDCPMLRLESATRKYSVRGCGYDLLGTAFGNYLQAEHQDALKSLCDEHASQFKPYGQTPYLHVPGFHGLMLDPADNKVILDGRVGFLTMCNFARLIGINVAHHDTHLELS